MTVQDWPCWFIDPAQDAAVDGDGPRCTNMNETRNETNHLPGHWPPVARGRFCDLTFASRRIRRSARVHHILPEQAGRRV